MSLRRMLCNQGTGCKEGGVGTHFNNIGVYLKRLSANT